LRKNSVDAAYLAFSPDGKLLAAANHRAEMTFFAVPSFDVRKTISAVAKDDRAIGETRISSFAFSPDGKRLAVATQTIAIAMGIPDVIGGPPRPKMPKRSTNLAVFSVPEGTEVLRLREVDAHGDFDRVAYFSNDTLAVARNDGRVQLVQPAKKSIHKELKEIPAAALDVTPDGKQIVVGNSITLQVWNAISGKRMRQFQTPDDGKRNNNLKLQARGQLALLRLDHGGQTLRACYADGSLHGWPMKALPADVADDKLREAPGVVQDRPILPPNGEIEGGAAPGLPPVPPPAGKGAPDAVPPGVRLGRPGAPAIPVQPNRDR
jgi:WD40 repeat protein